jgi:hypothetical protein
MHLIGKFIEPGQVGGLVDTLKNSGIQRRDMIISAYDEEKFEKMKSAIDTRVTNIMSDKDALGELQAFVNGIDELDESNGIVVSVKAPRHKAQEVKSVMEQAGAVEIFVDG